MDNKLLGITDEGINENGYLQIESIREIFKDINIDICFTSPLKRTIQTSEIICQNNIPIIIDDRLIERGFGKLEGGSGNIKYTKDFWNYYINKDDYGVEPLQDLFLRTKSFLNDLKNNHKDKNILIVSHAATIRALHFNIVGFNESTNMTDFVVDNGQVFRYDFN